MKQQKYTLTYDEGDLIEQEVKYRMNEAKQNKEEINEDEIRERVYNGDFLNFEWNDFKECLTEELKSINKNSVFKIKGKNMGWRNLEGFKILKAENGEELLNGILPKTNDFSLYVKSSKSQMVIKCSHHDAPTGEYYFIKPLSKKEFKQYENGEI